MSPYIACEKARVKVLANEDTHIVADANVSPLARATSVADTNFVSGTQKMFQILFRNIVSATNVSQFAQHGNTTFILYVSEKHYEQQCVRNNVSATMCPRLPGP